MAGLAAGIRLAMYDRSVLIVERHNAPGGLNGFYSFDGRKFDVGLHAVTNYVEKGVKGTPMGKLFRQLRIPREDFALCPQKRSRIAFPDVDLGFTNDISFLEQEVERAFGEDVDSFRALRAAVLAHDEFDLSAKAISAREVVRGYVANPLLIEMIFCPLMYYGSARENDMDWDQFVIMWKALFEEGFGRPLEGVRVVIRALLNRYRAVGGQRKMKCGVRRIVVDGERATALELDDGSVLTADHVISTAGVVETQRMCEGQPKTVGSDNIGGLSFVESITVLDCEPKALGWDETIVFFNDSERFAYERAKDAVDVRSGVICFPNNYEYAEGEILPEGLFRVTAMANFDYWSRLAEEDYKGQKAYWYEEMQRSAMRFLPPVGMEQLKSHTQYVDMFSPRTIKKFTGHEAGAIYGAPNKVKDGRTHLDNLYLAGTDQGFLGIIGAMLSGVSMANLHVLQGSK